MYQRRHRKVVIVGAGAVGATFAYALAQRGIAEEIVLFDMHKDFLQGQVLDLIHGQPFFPTVCIKAGTLEDYADAQLIVVTAGAAQAKGETRLQLTQRNAAITRQIVDDIVAQQSSAVMLMVNNPVDIMTRVALEHSGWDRNRVIGSGTVLDSARLRHLLAEKCQVDVHNIHAYVLGEHGDTEFAAWSMSHIAGTPIASFMQRALPDVQGHWNEISKTLEREVRESAYHIIDYKGATCFAVGLALTRICAAILRDEKSVLTVSVQLKGEYSLNNVCLSVPCVVGMEGMVHVVDSELESVEQEALITSAHALEKVYQAQ